MSKNVAADDEIEDCPELNDEYFAEVGQSFTVVDVWDGKEDDVVVKKEPKESSNSKSSSRPHRSTRSPSDASKKRSRSRSDRRSRSPERSRPRRSPPPFRRQMSPIDRRRRSPPRLNRAARDEKEIARERFLKELQDKFAKEGIAAPEVETALRQRNSNRNNYNNNLSRHNMHREQQQQQQANMNFMMMQQQQQAQQLMMNTMMPMEMQQQQMMMNMPYQMAQNPYGFPLQQQPPMISIPQPVPPPNVSMEMQMQQVSPPVVQAHVDLTSSLYDINSSSSSSKPTKEVSVEDAMKKALDQKKINLTDFLRQKSKQRNRIESSSDATSFSSKKSEVLKRCKAAANTISELEKQKKRFPLTCVLSNEALPTIFANHEFTNKSPLIANDNNLLFKFQATAAQCRKAVESNPIKNISGSMLPLARNLKMDLVNLSVKVGKEEEEEEEIRLIAPPGTDQRKHKQQSQQQQQRAAAQKPAQIFNNRKTVSRGNQTERFECKDCSRRDRINRDAKHVGSQTARVSASDMGTQCEDNNDDGGNFTITLDAKTLQDRTFVQHHALEVFLRAFNLPCKFLNLDANDETPYTRGQNEMFNETKNYDEERLSFANPENPNSDNNAFISLSPIHDSRRRSMSPRQHRVNTIFDRVGEKIHEPLYDDLQRSPSPPSRLDSLNMNRYRIPSPPPGIRHQLQERISPGPSHRFRNRSRTRSRSRDRFSPVPSPPRRRFDLNERRGRY